MPICISVYFNFNIITRWIRNYTPHPNSAAKTAIININFFMCHHSYGRIGFHIRCYLQLGLLRLSTAASDTLLTIIIVQTASACSLFSATHQNNKHLLFGKTVVVNLRQVTTFLCPIWPEILKLHLALWGNYTLPERATKFSIWTAWIMSVYVAAGNKRFKKTE